MTIFQSSKYEDKIAAILNHDEITNACINQKVDCLRSIKIDMFNDVTQIMTNHLILVIKQGYR